MTKEVMQQALDAQPAQPTETKLDRFLGMVRIWVERDEGNMVAALAWMYEEKPAGNNMEIVGYQYQWTNPADDPDLYNNPIEWQAVIPARDQTEQSKVDELLAHRYAGKPVYRVRAIYTPKETT